MPTVSNENLRVFNHLNVTNTSLYRQILKIFLDSKESFRLHLREEDIRFHLQQSALPAEDLESLTFSLSQLTQWGNIDAHPDTADVATIEDFYRPRFLYQLTGAGEAAERALKVYFEHVHDPGELQATSLLEIQALLNELILFLEPEAVSIHDDGKVQMALSSLCAKFEVLTAKAQIFMGNLMRATETHHTGLESFLEYKTLLIDYLEKFARDLVNATVQIISLLHIIESKGVDPLLRAATRRDMLDVLVGGEEVSRAVFDKWSRKWQGLTAWFISDGIHPSQADTLRAMTRSAIPSLLSAAQRLHDRRNSRSDRSADFRTLARWFAEAPTDREAHKLWEAAFGLNPTRHLSVNARTLAERDESPIPSHTSWLNSPPLRISPRLRTTGGYRRRGADYAVTDRSKEKALLAQKAQEEADQTRKARARLLESNALRLSDFSKLSMAEFDLFLDLLGSVLNRPLPMDDNPRSANSSDGSLRIVLKPAADQKWTTIWTPDGDFHTPDDFISIFDTFKEDFLDE